MASYVYNPSKKITEFLSQYLELPETEGTQQRISVWSGRVSLSNVTIRTSAINAHLQKYGWELQSGSIASFEMTIPLWKQLLQNKNKKLDQESGSHITVQGLRLRFAVCPTAEEEDNQTHQDLLPRRRSPTERRLHQKWIAEAERRRLAGLPIGPWLSRLRRQQEEQEIAAASSPRHKKKESLSASPDPVLQSVRGRESRLLQWIKQWTQDLLYQLFLGLTVHIDDMRVILPFPSAPVECGLIIPALHMTNPAADASRLHKHVHLPGLGIYVVHKKGGAQPEGERDETTPTILPNDYVLCPVDSDVQVTLLFSNPSSDATPAVISSSTSTRSTSIPEEEAEVMEPTTKKRRHRGKREKELAVSIDTTAVIDETFSSDRTPTDQVPSSLYRSRTVGSMTRKRSFYAAGSGSSSVDIARGHSRRSTTLSGPMQRGRKYSIPPQSDTAMGLPLAQPDDLRAHFQDSAARQSEPAIQLEGKLYMGAVQFRCTSCQYRWLNQALVTSRHIRHGRPCTSIRSVILQQDMLLEGDPLVPESPTSDAKVDSSYHPVISAWWRYAFRQVVRELRERQRSRVLFHSLFISFDWHQQALGRTEYVRLFIANRLDHRRSADEERLLALEDELPVEQVVLYRAIARAAHVRGLDAMPPSILDLQSNDSESMLPVAMPKEKEEGGAHAATDPRTHRLSLLDARGEVARARFRATALPLPTYPELLPSNAPSVEEVSFAAQTNRSNQSRRGVAGTMIDHMSSKKKDRAPRMMYSFSFQVQRLECLLVDEDDRVVMNPVGESSLTDSVSMDISVLTEEDRFVPEDSELRLDEAVDPINYAESDYVLFDLPQRVLLHIQLCPLECSLLGDSEKSRCFNFRIGQVKATGDNGFEFLSIGSSLSDGAALNDFMLTMDDKYPSVTNRGAESRKDAVFLSLVISNHHNFLQCDTPTLRASLEPSTVGKIASFLAKDAAQFPPPLLEISPREHVRRYVLREQNQTKSFNLNCSIRMQGFELLLCASQPSDVSRVSSAPSSQWSSTVAALRCTMIEVYSGSAVAELSASLEERQQFISVETRQLSMLDLTSTSLSLLSFRWVMAINGLDAVLSPTSADPKSLLRDAVTVELLYSIHLNSLLDFNRSKEEIVLEVSPVHVMLSEQCILELAKIEFREYLQLSSHPEKVGRKQPPLLPPRLEVLSSYMRYQLDMTLRGLRCSFLSEANIISTPASRRVVMEVAMMDFLRIASLYDLQFPHEDAIDAAMQVCVDRLVGVGLPIEVAFEAVNRVLLHLLEEVVDEPRGSSSLHPSNVETDHKRLKLSIIEKVVKGTSAIYLEYLEHSTPDFERSLPRFDLDIDVPDGVLVTWMSLFYDQHLSFHVPSVSVVDGEGIHLLYVASKETDEPSRSSVSNISDNLARSESSSGRSPSMRYGITLQMFRLDKGHHFGRGGLPLSILGVDVIVPESELRIRELFFDLDVDELEFTFARPNVDRIIVSFCRIFAPFLEHSTSSNDPSTVEIRPVVTNVDVFLLYKSTSMSFLFVSDGLSPFMRLSAADFVLKSERLGSLCLEGEEAVRTSRCNGRSFSLLNLTSDGELFPEVISVLPSHPSDCFSATIGPTSGIDVVVCGLRVCFLKQFLSEVLQYFVNGHYGFSRLLRERILPNKRADSVDRPKEKRSVSFRDISIILPRSCGSYVFVCVELSKASLLFCNTAESFVMPSNVNPLCCDDIPCGGTESLGRSVQQPISRLRICLIGFRIFSGLADRIQGNIPSRDSPSFKTSFRLDGRAEAGKRIFCPVLKESIVANDILDGDAWNETANSCWSEITTDICSLEIVVDQAPHLRLLIVDHSDTRCNDGISLDMRLSQFCLLLSMWFSNFQELPQLFSYPISQLHKGAKPLEVLSTVPDHGSEAFRTFLKACTVRTGEVAVVLRSITLRCVFDDKTLHDDKANEQGFVVGFKDVVVHVTNDKHGVARIGVGSSSASFDDESLLFSSVLSYSHKNCENHSWADLEFGLDRIDSLPSCLPQAFQLSICMTPGWQIYNLGLGSPRVTLSDLSPINKFLKFVSTYFTESRFGNPSLVALDQIKQIKLDIANESLGVRVPSSSLNAVNVSSLDFRLLLAKPFLSLPCNPLDECSPGLHIEGEAGFWYQYMTFGGFSSQQCVSDRLHLSFDKTILLQPSDVVDMFSGSKLVENLSVGLRLDSNSVSGHTDVCVQIPFDSTNACDITSPRIYLSPDTLAPPIICTPYEHLTRSLGPSVCEITCLIEILPLAFATLLNFLAVESDETELVLSSDHEAVIGVVSDLKRYNTPAQEKCDVSRSKVDNNKNTLSVVAAVRNARFFVLDPVLGPYLPLAVLSISSLSVTSSFFANELIEFNLSSDSVPSEDFQVAAACHLWADYFKLGLTRSWEPLIEAYQFRCAFEKSRYRGSGLSLNSDSRLHFNISSSLLTVLDEVYGDFMGSISRTFMYNSAFAMDIDESKNLQNRDRQALSDSVFGIDLTHTCSGPIAKDERVAFLLRNMTGQKMRIVRPEELVCESTGTAIVTYFDTGEATELTFPPCISVVKNLKVKEVAYPGLPNRTKKVQGDVSKHLIDLQIPGFHWLEGIEVDTFGRKFSKIFPRSPEVRTKIDDDWRLANMMQLLVEVGLRNGGRQVTVRSVVSVTNKTTHGLGLRFDPDPLSKPLDRSGFESDSTKEKITDLSTDFELCSGESLQVPTLLFESSLRHPGSNLGCLWIRPAMRSFDAKASVSSSVENMYLADDVEIAFSSRHVPFAKLVKESATMFEAARFRHLGPNQAKTKLQLSCPVARSSGDRLAPFCFAIEIDRSPIVPSREKIFGEKRSDRTHAPVTYALIVHPPIVIANFLPARSRFELMHAVNRMVLWSGELEPGQQVSVHSVGLDAPLLLFLNLGFAKTPVGEGALVHHGTDLPPSVRDNLMGLKSIGKAGKAVTKKIGKTLSSIGESPDRRGLKRIFMAQNPQMQSLQPLSRRSHLKPNVDVDSGDDSNEENFDGKTYKIDNFHYFADDVARQTSIVDSLGQKLVLSLENIRGGGGQRKITVFCRYWILNTTEHCLRYKQEGSKTFVTGTVLSPIKDGSLPLSGARSRSNYGKDGHESLELGRGRLPHMIFAGTPGALASSPGRCELPPDHVASLLDSNLPLERMANWAFMFNFHDGPVVNIGQQRLCVQLWDGTGKTKYVSDWSRGFGLDSVGVSQTIEMHCKDGRVLELCAFVSVAPGYLSSYTTIVRFLPRYAIVNNLPYQIRLWQDSSLFRPFSAQSNSSWETTSKWRYGRQKPSKVNQYELLWGRQAVLDERETSVSSIGTTAHGAALFIGTILPNEILPFCLPDSRGERQLRVDTGNPWSLSGSISSDIPGDFILAINRTADLKATPHVSTRSNPHYEVRLPPHGSDFFDGDLGIWFEPDYGIDRGLIVKAVKKNTYAFNETDVHVGDELLLIDGVQLSSMLFSEAIMKLKARLAELSTKMLVDVHRRSTVKYGRTSIVNPKYRQPMVASPVVLTFRTVEERTRKVRQRAADVNEVDFQLGLHHVPPDGPGSGKKPSSESETSFYVRADLKSSVRSNLGSFLVLREQPKAPYEIQNHSVAYTLYYRQRGCFHCCWQVLKPGQSTSYSWEEPLKPKKIVARVALDSVFFSSKLKTENTATRKENKRLKYRDDHRKVLDEEAFFSPSIVIPLEDVGFSETLSVAANSLDYDETLPSTKFLKLSVDVEGTARVLVLRESADEGNEEEAHIARSFETLQLKIKQEERRIIDLSSLKRSMDSIDGSRFSEETLHTRIDSFARQLKGVVSTSFVTGCHQIVVEVLEARGLNPESVVDSCSPYCEIRLKDRYERKVFLGKSDRRKTYCIRKTVSPVWKDQSFIFHVPSHAVAATYGYSIRLRVRNFRIFGRHQILGRAQVDLHSVRDQEQLTGWFPLVGRTDRRELDTQISHWGRGSIKLRVQWIYTFPGLVQYFTMLSEQRRLALSEFLAGLEVQESKRKESEKQKRAAIDGLKAVRMEELLSFRKKSRQKLHVDQMQHHRQRVGASYMKTPGRRDSIEPRLLTTDEPHFTVSSVNAKIADVSSTRTRTHKLLKDASRTISLHSLLDHHGLRKRTNSSHNIAHELEDQISQKRQYFYRYNSSKQNHLGDVSNGNGLLTLSFFRTWNMVQALFNDSSLDIELFDSSIKVNYGNNLLPGLNHTLASHHSDSSSTIEKKFRCPPGAPPLIRLHIDTKVTHFVQSRRSFERLARISMKTVLHSGGWLSIRPVSSLNLPDMYTGMAVKVKYGTETFVSETADARSLDPSWYKINHDVDASEEQWNVVSQGDIHIHVAPQKTNGAIRLSVVGEKGHKQLSSGTKHEVGVLFLPLGSTISACLDHEENRLIGDGECLPMLLRWFPLTTPLGSVKVEGDEGLTSRPPDTEKVSDNDFKEYFAPCIQLAIFWTPENDAAGTKKDDSSQRSYIKISQSHSSPDSPKGNEQIDAPLVQNYFNADISWVSVALLDSQRARELLALSLREVDVRYWVTTAKTRVGFSIGWLQLDYQDDDVREPVVLAPTPTDVFLPVIQVLVLKDNLRSVAEVMSFDFIDVSIAELDFTVEERLLFDLVMFWSSIRARKGSEFSRLSSKANHGLFEHLFSANDKGDAVDLFSSLTRDDTLMEEKQKIYIKDLVIGVVKINISYLKGKVRESLVDMPVDRVLRLAGGELLQQFFYKDEAEDFYTAWSQTTFDDELRAMNEGKESQSFPSFIATLFPNVSDAPLRLPGKSVKHTFESASDIAGSIRKFYTTESLKQFYKIVGALDFVGNPTMLVTSFFSGVRDLVVTPHTAIMNSPRDPSRLGIDFAKGTLSFVSHGMSGFFGYTSKLAAAAGQAVATISLDAEFRDWHNDKVVVAATNLNREWKRRGVQNVGMTLTRPIVDVVLGVAGGVSGVIISPIKGFKRNGPAGLPLGAAIGGIGLFAKPLVGMMDAVVHFSASIHDIAKSVNVLDRRLQPALKLRLPYVFGWMSILAPFQSSEARAVQLLKTFPARENHRRSENLPTSGECLIFVETLPSMGTEVFVIVTNLRVSLIRAKKEMSGVLTTTLCMEVYFSEDVNISSKVDDFGHNSVALILYKRDRDKLTRNESKRNGTLFALSPPLAWKTVTWRSTPGISSRDAATTAGTTIASDQLDVDDVTGDEGNLLDKFTILADYQYRPQLTRLHNAICCVNGDLDSVVPVSWLSAGSPTTSDGHTSFGIYYFDKDTDVDTLGSASLSSACRFEYLPWVPRIAFDLFRNETADTQKMLLSNLREECNFDRELERSQYEGGPDWLVAAHARVFMEEKLRLAAFLQGNVTQQKESQQMFVPISVGVESTRNDEMDDIDATSTSMRDSLVLYKSALPSVTTPSIRDSMALYKSAFQSLAPENPRNDIVMHDPNIPNSFGPLNDMDPNDEADEMGVEAPSSGMSNILTQFRRRRTQFQSPMASSYSTNASSAQTTRRRSNRTNTTLKENDAAVPPEETLDESIWIEPSVSKDETETISIVPASNMVVSDAEKSIDVKDDTREGEKNGGELRQDRLDRMEKILEQLLLFSSEQALLLQQQQAHATPRPEELPRSQTDPNVEVDALRREVQALRAQLQEVVEQRRSREDEESVLDRRYREDD